MSAALGACFLLGILVAPDVLGPNREPAPAAAAAPATAAPERHWYGGQTLLADGVALLVLYPLGVATSEDLGSASVAAYLVSGPVIHFVHGSPGRAAGDVLLRVALPVVGLFVGAAATSCKNTSEEGPSMTMDCGLSPVVGTLTGVLAAVAIDAAVLAYEDVPAPHDAGVGSLVLGPGPGDLFGLRLGGRF